MKKMKYLFVSVLVFLMLTGCGGNDNNQTDPNASPNTNATDNNGGVNGTSNNDGITGNTNDNGTNSSDVIDNAGNAVEDMGRGVADGVRDVGEGVADGIDNMTGDGNR